MVAPKFIVTERTSPCSFVRQFPHGAKHEKATLQLAVKEYRPQKRGGSNGNAVTIIATHGNGFPKECFEPLWDDLLGAVSGFEIDSIWVADVANQGASYALNAEELGDDPNWIDHSLDLLLMINKFRDRMKAPLIGVGHSMGCGQLAYLASVHPRLFHSLVLIEPVMQPSHPPGPNSALFSSMRRERWESRAKAESQISRNGFFQSMDSRALKLFLEYALRDTPDGGVTLSTPKAQEAWSYVRSNFHPMSEDTAEGRLRERLLNPDPERGSSASKLMTMRPEMLPICEALPHIRPRTLYIYGEYSHINFDEMREYHVTQTGSGRGGSGGVNEGGVKEKVLKDCGHLCVFEEPSVIAEGVSVWLGEEMARWTKEIEFWDTIDTGKSKNGRKELSDKWMAVMKQDMSVKRPSTKDLAKL
ncbi:alpha/beta-hydrolase [Cucurbitaria berberidis CBS 394.84]|uniref:Alpha/beta-hydrolase n=1 Tax=Cucurbitaria berberidis CBS 394.84 TaxID=1168544 RepID=A0A9P4G9T8_9PLEO|nr:alpha/beta-hydrolase [Cucurbitaria berberidis CBS 394.84]KAF1841651.1 alpha/beta-hydrolase [Cucurbitaria berberidis CBS 394.84]